MSSLFYTNILAIIFPPKTGWQPDTKATPTLTWIECNGFYNFIVNDKSKAIPSAPLSFFSHKVDNSEFDICLVNNVLHET